MAAVRRLSARLSEIAPGMQLQRLLPQRALRRIGAWCFLDHVGPLQFAPGAGLHVGPHPHIGLQTLSWMIEGEILHRDSLGHEQILGPGQIHLMSAGRGIVHSEDSVDERAGRLHMVQLWIALPAALQGCAPAFVHAPERPCWTQQGAELSLLVGEHAGRQAPLPVHSPLLALQVRSQQACSVDVELVADFEYGLQAQSGSYTVLGQSYHDHELAYLGQGHSRLRIEMAANSRCLLLGGAPYPDPLLMWWNFVAPTREILRRAQQDWLNGDPRFAQLGDAQRQRLLPPPWPYAVDPQDHR